MVSQSHDEQLALGLVAAIVVLVLALVTGFALQSGGAAGRVLAASPLAPLAEPAPAPATLPLVLLPTAASSAPAPSAQAASDAASITVEYGVVKFYFASGSDQLAAGAGDALLDVVRGARTGQQVRISGFHDVRGNAQANAALAGRRALAVREVLSAAGVPERQIRVDKPAQTAGSGSDAEARRVEITLQ